MPLILLSNRSKYPTGLAILGSTTVSDKSVSTYSCKLVYSNGATKTVTPTWSLVSNNAGASINNGTLTTVNVAADTSTQIHAAYTDPDTGQAFVETLLVTVQNNYFIDHLTVSGADLVTGQSTTQYGALANYSDGTSKVIAPTWSLTTDIAGATISNGLLTLPAVAGNAELTINISFTEDGVVRTGSKHINIGVVPNTLAISGATVVGDNATSQYTATVGYSDGTSKAVTPTWSLGGTDNGAAVSAGGLLTVPDLALGAVRPLTAAYTELGRTVTSTINLSLVNSYDIQVMEVIGPALVADHSATNFDVRITYTDGSTLAVLDNQVAWSLPINTVGATIGADGVLNVPDVAADGTVVVRATYTYLGAAKVANWTVNVSNSYRVDHLVINGSAAVADHSATAYSCTAVYPDGATKAVTPKWTLSGNEARAAISSGGTLTVPYLDGNGRVTIDAEFIDADQTVYASKVVEVAQQRGSIARLQVLGWQGVDMAVFDGLTSFAFGAVGDAVLPGNATDSAGYVSAWVDLAFGSFMAHVGGGNNAKIVFCGPTHYSGSQIAVKAVFWSQDKAYRNYSLLVNKPDGTAHVVVNYGNKKVWINGVYAGQMSAEFSAMNGTSPINNGLWLGASPAPNAIGQATKHYLMRAADVVFGSVNVGDAQAAGLHALGLHGDYAQAPGATAWYKLRDDALDYSGNGHHLAGMDVVYSADYRVHDGRSQALRCLAVYDDNSAKEVAATWSLSANTVGASISNGVLTVPELSGAADAVLAQLGINVSYAEGQTYTKSYTADVVNASYLKELVVMGDASLDEHATTAYSCIAVYTGGSATVTPTWSLSGDTGGATLNGGVLTAGGAAKFTLTASYTDHGVTRTVSQAITVSNTYRLSGLVIDGPAVVAELADIQYAAVALYNDGTNAAVRPTWSVVDPAGVHTIGPDGLLTTADVNGISDSAITIQAAYTENGVVKVQAKTLTLTNSVYLAAVLVDGPASNAGTSEPYRCSLALSNGTLLPGAPTWSVAYDAAKATAAISSGGVLTVSNVSSEQTALVGASATYKGVTVSGSAAVYIDVVPKTLAALAINGPVALPEQDVAEYRAVATYLDGTTADVDAAWSIVGAVPANVSLAGNMLDVGQVQARQTLVLKATYTENGVTVSRQQTVSIENTLYPTGITIVGNTEVSDKSVETYTVNVSYSNGTSSALPPSLASWSVTGAINASISTGTLTIPNIVVQNAVLTLRASYADSGVTVASTLDVIVSNLVSVSYLEIHGPDSIEDYAATSFTCRAVYPDNSYDTVTPQWSLHNNRISATVDSAGYVHVPDIIGNNILDIVAVFADGSTLVSTSKQVTVLDTYFDILSVSASAINHSLVRDVGGLDEIPEFPKNARFGTDSLMIVQDRAVTYLDDNATYDLTLTANVRDGTTRRVPQASWSMNTSDSRVSLDSGAGVLTTADVSGGANATVLNFKVTSVATAISSSFTSEISCSLRNTSYVTGIAIKGDMSMKDNSTQTLQCVATHSNAQQTVVSPTWSVVSSTLVPVSGSFGAVINSTSGELTIGDVGKVSGVVQVKAVYTEGGLTRSVIVPINVANSHYPTALNVIGLATVNDNARATYAFTAIYSDGNTLDVDANNVTIGLTGNTALAVHLGGGVFQVPDVTSQCAFTINATYVENGVTVTRSRTITVLNSYKIDHLEVVGPDTLSDKSTVSYAVNAVYSDGYVKPLSPTALGMAWTLDGGNAFVVNGNNVTATVSVVGGTLVLPNLPGASTKTIRATYTYTGGQVAVGTKTVTIANTFAPQSISVRAPIIMKDKSAYTLGAYAVYPDGSQVWVDPTWSLSPPVPGASFYHSVLTVPDVDQNYDLNIVASTVFEGVALSGTIATHITNFYGAKMLTIVRDSGPTNLYRISGQPVTSYGDNATHVFHATVGARELAGGGAQVTVVPEWSLSSSYGLTLTTSTDGKASLTLPDLSHDVSLPATPLQIGTLSAAYTEKGTTISASIPIYSVDLYRPDYFVIGGPTSVSDNSRTTLTCQVHHTYTNDLTSINPQLELTFNDCGASIEGTNVLVVPDLPKGKSGKVRVSATYTEMGVTLVAVKLISIVEAFGINSLAISGASPVNDKSSVQYTATVTYTDGTPKGVSPVWSITSDNVGATVDVYGVVRIPDSLSGAFTLNASYSEDARTVTSSKTVTVVNSYFVSSLNIVGASTINDCSRYNYACTALYNDGALKTVDPSWSVSGISGVTVSSTGELVVPDTAAGSLTLTASYVEAGVTVTSSKSITVVNAFKIETLTITGASSVNDHATSQYAASVTYSDGTTKVVTPTWSVNAGTTGVTVSGAGVLTVPNVLTAATIVLNASYTENGVTLTDSLNVLVNDAYLATGITIVGVSSVSDRSTSQYACTLEFSNGTSTDISGSTTWGIVAYGTGATVSDSGLLTVPDVAAATSVTITASYAEGGNAYTATKVVSVPNAFGAALLSISGSDSINAMSSKVVTYTATVTYTDSTTATVVPSWSIIGDAQGCAIDSDGVLSVAQQSASVSLVVGASYTENGITVTAQLPISLTGGQISAQAASSTTPVAPTTILYMTGDSLP